MYLPEPHHHSALDGPAYASEAAAGHIDALAEERTAYALDAHAKLGTVKNLLRSDSVHFSAALEALDAAIAELEALIPADALQASCEARETIRQRAMEHALAGRVDSFWKGAASLLAANDEPKHEMEE